MSDACELCANVVRVVEEAYASVPQLRDEKRKEMVGDLHRVYVRAGCAKNGRAICGPSDRLMRLTGEHESEEISNWLADEVTYRGHGR